MYEVLFLVLLAVVLFFEYRADHAQNEYYRFMFGFLSLLVLIITGGALVADAIGTPLATPVNVAYWLIIVVFILDLFVFFVGQLLPKLMLLMADFAVPHKARRRV